MTDRYLILRNVEHLLDQETRNGARPPKPLFGSTFSEVVVTVVSFLDPTPSLEAGLRAIGRKHHEDGITPKMYAWFEDALLAEIRMRSGPMWSRSLDIAWRQLFRRLTAVMLAGVRDPGITEDDTLPSMIPRARRMHGNAASR